MHKQKTFLTLTLAGLLLIACSLTSGATGAALSAQNAPATPTAADQPETIATPTAGPTRCTVTAHALNVRTCAGVDCVVIAQVTQGDQLQVLGTANGWQNVQTEAGAAGFVNSQYCKKTE